MSSHHLPPEIQAQLAALDESARCAKTDLARQEILEKMDDLEDAYLAALSAANVRAGTEVTYTLDEVKRALL